MHPQGSTRSRIPTRDKGGDLLPWLGAQQDGTMGGVLQVAGWGGGPQPRVRQGEGTGLQGPGYGDPRVLGSPGGDAPSAGGPPGPPRTCW